jgi:hypothetical protein
MIVLSLGRLVEEHFEMGEFQQAEQRNVNEG